MNHEVIVTCAVTGAGDTVGRHPAIPVTPKQIAEAAIEAARAGATVAHCHVRDPATGKPSRDVALYREVVERIRESDTDVIINLTAGMGGDLEIGKGEQPLEFGAGTDLATYRGGNEAGHRQRSCHALVEAQHHGATAKPTDTAIEHEVLGSLRTPEAPQSQPDTAPPRGAR